MNLDEARALLGISPDDSETVVRRAYLRKIKTVKPERDPEGFKRVRAAYDLLRESAPPEEVNDGASRVEVTVEGAATFSGPAPHAPPAPDPVVAVRDLFASLATRGPEAVGSDFVELMEAAIATGRFEELDPDAVIELGLANHCVGARDQGNAILWRWFSATDEQGISLNTVRAERVRLLGARELSSLPPSTPIPFTQAMAAGLLAGSTDEACEELARLADTHPLDAKVLRDQLYARFPVLFGLYVAALRVFTKSEKADNWLSKQWWWNIILVIGAIGFVYVKICSR